MSVAARWAGHVWTVAPRVRPRWPRSGAPDEAIEIGIEDARVGLVRLHAYLDAPSGARTLALIVHGLGGDADSVYVESFARVARTAGMATLRVHLRGADMRGEDFYHAGLFSDLHALLASEKMRTFESLVIVGFSLGGHVTLAYAAQKERDPRIAAVVGVCAPLDLDLGARAFDAPRCWVYRTHILAGLKQSYAAVALRHGVPTPVPRVKRIRAIREWDELTVAPRYGFASAADYYDRVSVGPRLGSLDGPTLLVYARHDPLVTWDTVAPSLANVAARAHVVCAESGGGHVGFAPGIDLGLGGERGLDRQILAWLERRI